MVIEDHGDDAHVTFNVTTSDGTYEVSGNVTMTVHSVEGHEYSELTTLGKWLAVRPKAQEASR